LVTKLFARQVLPPGRGWIDGNVIADDIRSGVDTATNRDIADVVRAHRGNPAIESACAAAMMSVGVGTVTPVIAAVSMGRQFPMTTDRRSYTLRQAMVGQL
jgi:hypothetical protein